MKLRQANRTHVKIKMGLQGASGSGKTYSALLLAFGLCNDWSKIAVIDTENHSSELYAALGDFKVLNLSAPFTPERYIEAIKLCENNSIEVIIIDGLSQEWQGAGGILEQHGNMIGNSYTNWNKLSPKHNAFIQYMLQSHVHIISTLRSKQDYVLNQRSDGKLIPEKIGLKAITREGLDYEFTLLFELNAKNLAIATKDRTSLFINKPEMIITPDTGRLIKQWCMQGVDKSAILIEQINVCKSVAELLSLHNENPTTDTTLLNYFTAKRKQLQNITTLSNLQTIPINGNHYHAAANC